MLRMRFPIAMLLMVTGLWWCSVGVAAAQEAEPADANEEDKQITMDFQDVDLGVLVKFISEITHKNFIVDERVKGKITIISPRRISVDEAYLVFQSVLQVKGFTTVPSGSVIKIVPSKDAKSTTLRTIVPQSRLSPSDEFITRLIPLKHVGANDMIAILQPMVSPDGLLAAYEATNMLILIDTGSNTARLMRILAELDVEGFERGIEVIRLNYAFATEIAATLEQVLEEDTSQTPSRPAPVRGAAARRTTRGRAVQPGQATVAGGSTEASAFKIIPDERTNSLIVVAGPLPMRRIKELIAQLDVPLPLGTGRIHVYHLKYANSYEMVTVLSDLIGGGGGGIGGIGAGLTTRGLLSSTSFRGGRLGERGSLLGGGSGTFGEGLGTLGGGGLSAQRLGGRSGGRLGSRTGLGAGTGFGGAPGAGGAASVEAEGIRITADPSTNALIVVASPQDYEAIKEIIDKLDVRRRQVYVEAIILEVRLDKARNLGFDFQGGAGLGNGVGVGRVNLTGSLNALSSPVGIGSLSGLLMAALSNQTVRLPDGSTVPAQAALFTALQNDTDVNILSAPNLLTTDNQEAEIVVGQNLPFLASRSTSETNLANQFSTIERRDVGITLRITPQISEGGSVRLDIFQEVSAVVPTAVEETIALGPTTTIRSATTTVVARDNETVVIGGLISDDITNTQSQVPFLGDIPVFGNLLRASGTRRQKVNLLIFLTPHIVRTEQDQRRMSRDQRDRLKAFMEEHRIPNRRPDVLDTPSWEGSSLEGEPSENSDEQEDGDGSEEDSFATESLDHAGVRAPVGYVLLGSFWENGTAPPSLAVSSGLVPLALPEDSGLGLLFERGQTFRFQSDSYGALFHCLDTFANAEEARVVYPEGLRVSHDPRELLHWRALGDDVSARNTRSWTKVN